jgi:hypothetical protein
MPQDGGTGCRSAATAGTGAVQRATGGARGGEGVVVVVMEGFHLLQAQQLPQSALQQQPVAKGGSIQHKGRVRLR